MSKPAFYGALSAQEVFFYPDMALDALPERLHVGLPLGGRPGIQLLLRTGGEAVQLTLEGGGFAAEYYAMRAVPVEYNTGDGTQQTAHSIRQLSELAQELKSSVSRFKVS